MLRWLFLLLPILAGLAAGAQAPINSALGRRIGILEAAFVSFAGGTVAAGLLVLLAGRGSLARVIDMPRWLLVGGLLGLFYVAIIITTVPRLGAASAVFAGIAGQLVFTVAADHFGWVGLPRIPFGAGRAVGLALMAAGTLLVFRSR